MCGFVGVVDYSGSSTEHHVFLDSALLDLQRRGPDDCDRWEGDAGQLVGFARLSIRDLSKSGSQPMRSRSGRFVLLYNGEIYNTGELTRVAKLEEANLRGTSDTEVLLEAIETIGLQDALSAADGIFALALLDTHDKTVWLARDHAGVKPLYFGVSNLGLVFSSHYHHITSHTFFRNRKLNVSALANYFRYGFIQEGEGLLGDTFFMPHGHIARFDGEGKWSLTPYISFEKDRLGVRESEHEPRLVDTYRAIVKSQMVSDVALGTFMSGGVDSTLTTGIACEIDRHTRAYTIGVDDSAMDEAAEAARFAAYFMADHRIERVTEQEVVEALNHYEDSAAEPLADFSSLLTLKVCEAAKKDLTVVLSGDGGDELFWGYERFARAAAYYEYLALPFLKRICRIAIERAKGNKIPWRLLKYRGFSDYYLNAQGLPGNSSWVDALLSRKVPNREPLMYRLTKRPLTDNEDALIFAKELEFHIHMQRVLLKVDRASMYHSLEVRTPMLSKVFIDLSKGFSFENCVNSAEGKIPLRKALKSIVPPGIEGSGLKKGFSPPMAAWLRGPLKQRVEHRILKIPALLQPHLNVKSISKMWNEHQEGKDWSWMIWSIYTLFSWVENKMFNYAR